LSDEFIERDFELCKRLIIEVFDPEKCIPNGNPEKIIELTNML